MSWLAPAEIRRLFTFAVVGTLNTAICYALFVALVELAAWHYNAALVADYAFGIGLGFVLHRVATFADRREIRGALAKYTLTLVATFLANLALLDLLVELRLLDAAAAQAVATLAVTLLSYTLQQRWVFRSHAAPGEGTATQADEAPRRMAA